MHDPALVNGVVQQVLLERLHAQSFIFLRAGPLLSCLALNVAISVDTLHHAVEGAEVVRVQGQLWVDVGAHRHHSGVLAVFSHVPHPQVEGCGIRLVAILLSELGILPQLFCWAGRDGTRTHCFAYN